jgi:hypothetical protein
MNFTTTQCMELGYQACFLNALLMSSCKTCRTKVPAGHAKTTRVKMDIGNNWGSVRHLKRRE